MNYHITPDGPKPCEATIQSCKYGKNNGKHYDNQEEASIDYHKNMENKYGALGHNVSKKTNNSSIQKYFRKSDRIDSSNPISKNWDIHKTLRNQSPSSSKLRRQERNERRSGRTKLSSANLNIEFAA